MTQPRRQIQYLALSVLLVSTTTSAGRPDGGVGESGADAGARCVVDLIAADTPPGARVPLLAGALSRGTRPAYDVVLLDAMAADLPRYTEQVANLSDHNEAVAFWGNLALLVARRPDDVRSACARVRDLPLRAECLARSAEGAADPVPFLNDATAALEASVYAGFGFGSAVERSISVLPKISAAKRAALAAKLVAAARRLTGQPDLRKMCEQLAGAGELDSAAKLARFGSDGSAVEGLSGAAKVACRADSKGAGAALAREAAELSRQPGTDSTRVARMSEAASALHLCGLESEAKALAGAAVKSGFGGRSARERTHALSEAVEFFSAAGMEETARSCADRMVKELAPLDRDVAESLAFLARRLSWHGAFGLALAIVANLPLESRSRVLDDIVEKLLKAKMFDAALAAASTTPNRRARAFQFSKITKICADARPPCAEAAMDALVPLVRTMPQNDAVWVQGAQALCEGGRVDKALVLARSLSDRSNDGRLVKARTMTTIATALAQSRSEQTIAIVSEAARLADVLTMFSDDRDWLLSDLARAALDVGAEKLAREVAGKIARAESRRALLSYLTQKATISGTAGMAGLRAMPDGHDKAQWVAIWMNQHPAGSHFACPMHGAR